MSVGNKCRWLPREEMAIQNRHSFTYGPMQRSVLPFLFHLHFTFKSGQIQCALLEAAALPSVFTLGKEPFALGKGFAECSTRQSPLGKIFLGKGSLPSAFYRGTRQNKKNFAECLGRHSAKYFRPLRAGR